MFTLTDLTYEYDALEPYIDTQTMKIHHDLHHGGYVKKLNAALEGQEKLLELSVEELVAKLDDVPSDKRLAVRNNGGGHANHSLFWSVMGSGKGGDPIGEVKRAVDESFGGFDELRDAFKKAALTQFGSGWAWVVSDGGALHVTSTPNQDSPLMDGKTPVLGLDVWEHAYYLKYQNKRADYISAWWNLVNWEEVDRRYIETL